MHSSARSSSFGFNTRSLTSLSNVQPLDHLCHLQPHNAFTKPCPDVLRVLQPGVDIDAELIPVDLVPPVPGYVQHISWLECHNVGSSHGQIGKDPGGVMGQVDEDDRAVNRTPHKVLCLERYCPWSGGNRHQVLDPAIWATRFSS